MYDNQAQPGQAGTGTGRLLTLREALAFLRISRATFYRQRAAEGGALARVGRKIGAQWRFTQQELETVGLQAA